MVRRHPSSAKKTKNSKPRGVNRKESKIDRWNKESDIPLDKEDQFHASRDKILLEGDDAVSDEGEPDDEVFALKGMSESSEEDEGEDEEGEDEEDEGGLGHKEHVPTKNAKKSDRKRKTREVSEEESEEEESWGNQKSAYYSSNAAQLESEDEEANDMEEQEARRLQGKLRDALADDDFGLGDAIEVMPEQDDVDTLIEPPAPVLPSLPQDKKSIIRHLEKTSPETLALAGDWEDIVSNLLKTQQKLDKLQLEDSDPVIIGMAHLHYQALLTYTTTLAFYLHLRASEKYAQNPDLLRSHPILPRLLTLKKSVATLEDLDFDLSDSEDDEDEDEDGDEEIGGYSQDDIMKDAENLWKMETKKGLDLGELENLLSDADSALSNSDLAGLGLGIKSKSRRQPAEEEEEEGALERPKKKRKTKSSSPVFDLEEPDLSSLSKSSLPRVTDWDMADDMYGEATALPYADAADKKAHKKTLRFYTSRVESASARRQNARAALGGDDDVPYRDRKKQKQDKLLQQAQARAKQGGNDLDGADPEPNEKYNGNDGNEEPDEDVEGYYSLVKQKKKDRKDKKKVEYEAVKAASRPDYEDEQMDGPRALTRAILNNKGLTPHRSKAVRNPRVKKRQKFDKAKKKIASQKATYKTDAGDSGRYDGEKSGISKVVKSVRL